MDELDFESSIETQRGSVPIGLVEAWTKRKEEKKLYAKMAELSKTRIEESERD